MVEAINSSDGSENHSENSDDAWAHGGGGASVPVEYMGVGEDQIAEGGMVIKKIEDGLGYRGRTDSLI